MIFDVSQNVYAYVVPAMNWFIISLVFHVLRLNLCVALSQACTDDQYLSASGVCVDCTICDELENKVVLRPCGVHGDAICESVSDGSKINDVTNHLTVNNEGEFLEESKTTADTDAADYYDEDAEDYDSDNSTDTLSMKTSNSSVKKTNQETFTPEPSLEMSKNTKKPIKYPYFPDIFFYENKSVVDLDTLIERTKKLEKLKSKKDSIQVGDHALKIGDTKFKIGDEKSYDGRWLQLSHPHLADKGIYVDLAENASINKKGSTSFNSREKQSDQEYFNEMTKLLNKTSSILAQKDTTVLNQTTQTNAKDEDYDNNNVLKNLDDVGDDDDDDDEDDDDSEEDEDEDEDDDEDDDDDEDSLADNNANPTNDSNSNDGGERKDFDADYDYDVSENDFYQDSTFKQFNNDIIAEPFVSTANWQILILVAAMSACLLFFIVVSAYICIFMRKRDCKTAFVSDVDDISVRVNLMQSAGFEVDDPMNIKNYIKHLRKTCEIKR